MAFTMSHFQVRDESRDHQRLIREYAQKMLSWRMNHDEQTLTHIALVDPGPVSRRAPRY